MSRIAFADGFRRIVASGQTPAKALKALNRERARGLQVWCGDRLMSEDEVRDELRFRLDPNGENEAVVFPAGSLGWETKDKAGQPITYTFELDTDQVEKLIAKLKRKQKPKREPMPRGRHQHAMKEDILAEYDRRGACTPPGRCEPGDLWAWAEKELNSLEKYINTPVPHVETIAKWLREERGEPPT